MRIALLFFIIITYTSNATVQSNNVFENNLLQTDSLVLKKNNSEKIAVIPQGKRIKVWKDRKTAFKGNFLGIEDALLVLKIDKEETVKIALNEIQKIKLIGSLFREIASGTLMSIGVIGIGVGMGLFIAAAATASGYGSGIILAVSAVIMGGGTPFFVGGSFLSGRRFNLEKKWTIQLN